MGIGKWESFLENHIEGFFNKKFSSDLEPVELSKALEKEIARQGKGKAGRQVPINMSFSSPGRIISGSVPNGSLRSYMAWPKSRLSCRIIRCRAN